MFIEDMAKELYQDISDRTPWTEQVEDVREFYRNQARRLFPLIIEEINSVEFPSHRLCTGAKMMRDSIISHFQEMMEG